MSFLQRRTVTLSGLMFALALWAQARCVDSIQQRGGTSIIGVHFHRILERLDLELQAQHSTVRGEPCQALLVYAIKNSNR